MGARRGRRVLCGVVLAAAVTAVGVAPTAADTDLVIGGQAIVSYTENGVNVRDGVGANANLLFAIPKNAKVEVIGGPASADDGSLWYNVKVNGTVGWIISDYLSVSGGDGVAFAETATNDQGGTLAVFGTNGNGLRLRDAASLNSTTLTVMPDGAQVTVVGGDTTDGSGTVWANVSYNGTTGYSSREFLQASDGAPAQATQASDPAPTDTSGLAVGANAAVANTNGDGLNLRSAASYSAAVATVAAEGDVVHIIDGPTNADGAVWWGVDYKGLKGWMDSSYLVASDQQPSQAPAVTTAAAKTTDAAPKSAPAASSIGEQIVAEAMKFVGYPYVWGGTTPAGFDCSGFLYYVVNQVTGGGFPRAIDGQASSGSYVDPDNLQPGDLVFQQNTYQWGLSHAGIYIGNGKFINAANESTGVIVSDLWDSYWGPRFYTARRIGG